MVPTSFLRNALITTLAVATISAGYAHAQDATVLPATTPAPLAQAEPGASGPDSAPSDTTAAPPPATAPAVDPQVLDLLQRIEAASQQVQTLQAHIRYDRIQGLVGDRQRRLGTLYYQAGPPARFAAHLEQRLADGRLDAQDRWYIFDGVWMVEKIADPGQSPKLFSKRQVVSPQDQSHADPLALGDGPFALPINLQKDLVLARFAPALVAPQNSDPDHSVHLALVPHPGQHLEATRIDLWYQRDTLLPLRAQTVDDNTGNASVVDLSDLQLNHDLPPQVFATTEPARNTGWDVTTTPWRDSAGDQ